MKKIVLFDPALNDNTGLRSTNLGDCIISQASTEVLDNLFSGNAEVIRVSTHAPLGIKERKIIKEADLSFVGGSNLLSSELLIYNQWKMHDNNSFFRYLISDIGKVILLGVGWWQYQRDPDFITKWFYRGLLHEDFDHSVRDEYTKNKLLNIKGRRFINTSCHTTWGLDGIKIDKENFRNDTVLVTLTDYNTNSTYDSALIEILLEHYKILLFFPQGANDLVYFEGLEIYQRNKHRVRILERKLSVFEDIVINGEIDYIGTRLHGGIRCLQKGIQSLILSVDNRAIEIKKDINLPVVERSDLNGIKNWIEGRSNYGSIHLDIKSIKTWKEQFR
jgi:hypothetical protein